MNEKQTQIENSIEKGPKENYRNITKHREGKQNKHLQIDPPNKTKQTQWKRDEMKRNELKMSELNLKW